MVSTGYPTQAGYLPAKPQPEKETDPPTGAPLNALVLVPFLIALTEGRRTYFSSQVNDCSQSIWQGRQQREPGPLVLSRRPERGMQYLLDLLFFVFPAVCYVRYPIPLSRVGLPFSVQLFWNTLRDPGLDLISILS